MLAVKRKAESSHDARSAPSNGNKKRRTYTDEDAKLAEIFEKLASDANASRLDAAHDLVNICAEETAKLDSTTFDFANEAAQSSALIKILRRLSRGLCSSRKAARVGFFIALTEVLRSVSEITLTSNAPESSTGVVLRLVIKQTELESENTKQEKRDYQIGRVSALAAFVQSGVLFLSQQPNTEFKVVLKSLCSIAKDTVWLREECGLILCEAVKCLARLESGNVYPETILQSVCDWHLAATSEGMAIWLECMSHFPEMKFPKNYWHHKDPLSRKELSRVTSILAKGEVSTSKGEEPEDGGKLTGSRRSAPHFAWDVVLRHLTGSSETLQEKRRSLSFEKFWIKAVDEIYFADAASTERKSLGFLILSKVISTSPAQTIPPALSPKLMRCLLNQSSRSERYLHSAALSVMKLFVSRAQSEPRSAAIIVGALLQLSGVLDFDNITGTKTIQSILTNCEEERAMHSVLDLYRSRISRPGQSDPRNAEKVRLVLADQLLNLIKSHHGTEITAGVVGAVNIFVDFSHHVQNKDCEPQISTKSQEILRSKLQSSLAHILSIDSQPARHIPAMVAERLSAEEIDGDETVKDVIKDARRCLSELSAHKKTDESKLSQDRSEEIVQAYELVFAFSIMQAYDADGGAIETLQDLLQSYENIEQLAKTTDSSDMMVELALEYSSKQSGLYRQLGEIIFAAFATRISVTAMQSMLEVLKQKEDNEGQKALFEIGNGEVEAEEDDSPNESGKVDEEDDDVELIEEEESSESDNEIEQSDEERSSEEDEELRKFDALLASTLKTSPLDGTKPSESDSDDSSDESMDDEQMMALDPHLTEIFRQRAAASGSNIGTDKQPTSHRKQQKQAKQNVVNFKNRVLDLLLIYVRQRPLDSLTLDIILPLLQLIRTTRTKQLANKATNLLKKYFEVAKKKRRPVDQPAQEQRPPELFLLLQAIHDEALLFASKNHADACSKASLFVARLVGFPEGAKALESGEQKQRVIDTLGDLEDAYSKTRERANAAKSGLPDTFWTDWDNWSQSIRGLTKG